MIVLIGKVGQGKSTLIKSILGEVKIMSGDLLIHCSCNERISQELEDNRNRDMVLSDPEIYGRPKIAYAPQSPWLRSSRTVRENIIENQPFDERRYRQVCILFCFFFFIPFPFLFLNVLQS